MLKKDYSIKEASHETRSSVTIFFFVRPQKTDRDHPPFVVLDLSSAIDHAVWVFPSPLNSQNKVTFFLNAKVGKSLVNLFLQRLFYLLLQKELHSAVFLQFRSSESQITTGGGPNTSFWKFALRVLSIRASEYTHYHW